MPILPLLTLAAVLMAPIAPAVEHNRLNWIFGNGGRVQIDEASLSRRAFVQGWTGSACESRMVLYGLADVGSQAGAGSSLKVVIDWSRFEAPATTLPDSTFVRLEGPFGPGAEKVRGLTFEFVSAPVARSALDAFNRLRDACRPQA